MSINGANRLGSNSLTEMPGLRRAGRQGRGGLRRRAGRDEPVGRSLRLRTSTGGWRTRFLRKTGGKEKIASLRAEMHQIMEESAGIYRTEHRSQGGGGEAEATPGEVPGPRPRRSVAIPSTPS